MARRYLRQVSFADGLVNQRAGRNSWMDEIDKLIDWSAVVKLLDWDLWQRRGPAVLSAFDLCEAAASAAVVRVVRPGSGGGGGRSAVVSPLRRSAVGRECARPFDDLALPPGVGGARTGRGAVRGDQPPARCPRADRAP